MPTPGNSWTNREMADISNESCEWLMETARLRMKPVTVNDAELMLAIWNDPAFIRNVTDRGIRTLQQSRDAIKDGAQKLFQDYGYGPYCMSLKSDGSMIGICGLFRRDNLDALPDHGGNDHEDDQ